jgi:gamma-glutamyltranspeptidase/glutathione hydrolase
VGTILRNPELAHTFEQIAAQGPEAFYSGEMAEAIVATVRSHANAGYLSLQDLQQYQAKEREPVCGPLQGLAICGMPPPSSGGVTVLQTLGMLEAVQRTAPQRDLAALRPLATSSPARLEAPPWPCT